MQPRPPRRVIGCYVHNFAHPDAPRAIALTAVEQGRFYIYPVRTIDEGIALLTGVRAGTVEEESTVNGLVNKRLRDLATGLKAFVPSGGEGETKRPDERSNHR